MKKSFSEKVWESINIIILTFLGFMALYPFYYVFIYSISDPIKAIAGVYLLPKGFTLTNYIQILSGNNLFTAVFISLLRTVIGTFCTVVCCSIFAYGVTKPELPFRKLLYRGVIITMYFTSGLIPFYITIKSLGLKNNFLVYILPLIMVPFFIVLIKTYFEQLPAAIEESAMVDGASYFTTFVKIVLPVSAPIIATVAIFTAVMQWNSWQDNLYFCSTLKLQTLQLVLYNFLNQQTANMNVLDSNVLSAVRVTPTSIRMGITMIVTLPVFLIYPFLQKYFLKGILLGAIKG